MSSENGHISSRLVRQGTNLELPMSALVALAELKVQIREAELAAIGAARERGATWEDIAGALGVTRQALHQRLRTARRRRPAHEPAPLPAQAP